MLVALWARTAATAAHLLAQPHDNAAGSADATEPARAAAIAAASQPGLDEMQQLARRVAELEQRLAGLEGGRNHTLNPKPCKPPGCAPPPWTGG